MKVGDKVVCIKDDWFSYPNESPNTPHPVKDCIYTVNWVGYKCGELNLGFKEMDQSDCFLSTWFRPIEPTSTKHEFKNEVTKELVREFEEVPEKLEKETQKV